MFEKLLKRIGINNDDVWNIVILKQEDDSGIIYRLHDIKWFCGSVLEAAEKVDKFNREYANTDYTACFFRRNVTVVEDYPELEGELEP